MKESSQNMSVLQNRMFVPSKAIRGSSSITKDLASVGLSQELIGASLSDISIKAIVRVTASLSLSLSSLA